eukprot:104252_1
MVDQKEIKRRIWCRDTTIQLRHTFIAINHQTCNRRCISDDHCGAIGNDQFETYVSWFKDDYIMIKDNASLDIDKALIFLSETEVYDIGFVYTGICHKTDHKSSNKMVHVSLRLLCYKVRLLQWVFHGTLRLHGWGLHCGWAIEGAIGSRYKIDASYLSPFAKSICR